jgi:hypothetical protein
VYEIIAQATGALDSFTPTAILQLSTAAGFGGLLWYIIVKEIPRQQADNNKQHEQRDQVIKYLATEHREALKETVSTLKQEHKEEIVRVIGICEKRIDKMIREGGDESSIHKR